MIEIILTVCAIANPSHCEEKYLQFAWDGSISQCMMAAQPYIAAVDWQASGVDGEEMELRLSRQREAGRFDLAFGPVSARGYSPFLISIRAEGNAPGQFADLNGFDDPLGRDVDHRNVVRDAIGDQQVFFVRRKSAVPNSLPDQQIFQDGVRDAVDHGHAIGGPEVDEAELAILGDIDADGLDGLGSQARNFER